MPFRLAEGTSYKMPNFLNASVVLIPSASAFRTRFSPLTFSSASRSVSSAATFGTTTTPS